MWTPFIVDQLAVIIIYLQAAVNLVLNLVFNIQHETVCGKRRKFSKLAMRDISQQ